MNLDTELSLGKKFVAEHHHALIYVACIFISLFGVQFMAVSGLCGRLFYSLAGELFGSKRLTHLLAWSACISFFYLFLPSALLLLKKEKLADYGWQIKPILKHLPYYVLFFVPIGIGVFFAASQPSFYKMYPFYKDPSSLGTFFLWELFYGIQFISLEFFFRGFILHSLKRRFGYFASVVIMSLPYMMIHFPKTGLETACAVGFGIILAIASLRTKSIFGGILIHLFVAITMDLSALFHKGWFAQM